MSENTTSQNVLGAASTAAGASALSLFLHGWLFKGILIAVIIAALIVLGFRLYKIYLAKKQAN